MAGFCKNWFKVKINHDYFNLNNRFEQAMSFLRQGNWFSHAVDRFKWHFGPKFFYLFDFPTHVDIEASSRCQMKCPMCGRWLMKEQDLGDMDFELYKKVIDECSRYKVYSVKLSWRGEPLLNPRIVDMVKYAKDKKIKDVAFLTNAERLSPELIEKLIDAGLDWISISFDGLGETYERIRYPAKFDKVVENVKYIRKAREMRKQVKPLIRVQTIWSAIKDDPDAYFQFWKPIADKVAFIADQIRSSESKDFEHDASYICQSPWQRICVMWDGRIAQCHSDYQERNILGDVKKHSLKEIWYGEAFARVRGLMRDKKRLALSPCQVCCDGGITRQEEVSIEGRKMKVNLYVSQNLDISSMDAREKVKK